MTAKRLSRAESQAQTKSRILQSAAEIFVQDGFSGAAVDKIAEKAGYSRGAFYANFKSKDDLFISLVEEHMRDVTEKIRVIAESDLSAKQKLAAFQKFYIKVVQDKESCILVTELFLYAIRNHKMKERLHNINQRHMDVIIGLFEGCLPSVKKKNSGKKIVYSLFAFIQGAALRHSSMKASLVLK